MITDSILAVLSRPVAGRDDDFNDWYSHIHIRDALRFRGGLSSQRFAPDDGSAEAASRLHLALYEVSHPETFTQEHRNWAGTPKMRTTSAFDRSEISDYYYRPVSYRRTRPGDRLEGPVVLERYVSGSPGAGALLAWLDGARRDQLGSLGIDSRILAGLNNSHQMLAKPAEYDVIAIHRVADLKAARQAWPDARERLSPALGRVETSFWRPITRLLTAEDLIYPTSAAMAGEERARAHMGDDFLAPNPGLLG